MLPLSSHLFPFLSYIITHLYSIAHASQDRPDSCSVLVQISDHSVGQHNTALSLFFEHQSSLILTTLTVQILIDHLWEPWSWISHVPSWIHSHLVLSISRALGILYTLVTCKRIQHQPPSPQGKAPNVTNNTPTSQLSPLNRTQHSSDLSDFSDNYIIIAKHACPIEMASRLATISHPIMSHAPVMTDGNITPKIIWDFKTHCMTYFINMKDGIAKYLKVTKILGCFENDLVADWAATEQEWLAQLTFEDFMKEFRECWLLEDWEQIIHVEMLGTCLDPKIHCFESWAVQIMLHNISL